MYEFWADVATRLWEWKLVVILPLIIGLPIAWVLRLWFSAQLDEIDRSCERTRQRSLADFAHKKEMLDRALQKAEDDRLVATSLGSAKKRSDERRAAEEAEADQFDALLNQARGVKNG